MITECGDKTYSKKSKRREVKRGEERRIKGKNWVESIQEMRRWGMIIVKFRERMCGHFFNDTQHIALTKISSLISTGEFSDIYRREYIEENY